jgi:hypothetical protein
MKNKELNFEAIRVLLDQGVSPKAIAKQYDIDISDITSKINEHYSEMYNNAPVSPKETLTNQLNSCRLLFEIARINYISSPNKSNSEAVTGFSNAIQTLLRDIGNLSNDESKISEIVETVIQPIVRNAIIFLGENITNIIDGAGFGNKELKNELTTLSKNFGDQLTNAYKSSLEKLGKIYNCEFDTGIPTTKNDDNKFENESHTMYG